MSFVLLRNLVIIVVLSAGIYFVYQNLEAKKQRNQEQIEENQRKEAEFKKKQEEARRQARSERSGKKGSRGGSENRTMVATSGTLEDLRQRLKGGDRSQFPQGARQIEGRWFYFVDEPMSWEQAWRIADQYGARLACFESLSELKEVGSLVTGTSSAWIGAGDSGTGSFVWIDGRKWAMGTAFEGKSKFAGILSTGELEGISGFERRPFVIEWTEEVEPVGGLSLTLKRFDPSTGSFPVGTIEFRGTHYLALPYECSYSEAMKAAQAIGGRLVVPRDSRDTQVFTKLVERALMPGDRSWVGATYAGDRWLWRNGLPLGKGGIPSSEAGNALAMLRASSVSLVGVEPEGRADFLLVQWGDEAPIRASQGGGEKDKSGEGVEQTGVVDATNDEDLQKISELSGKAKTMVIQQREKRSKMLTENLKKFSFDLNVWHRGLASTDHGRFEPMVKMMLGRSQGEHLEAGWDLSEFPEKIQRLYQRHQKKEEEIEQEHQEVMKHLHQAYCQRLEQLRTEAESMNKRQFSKNLDERLEQVKDSWEDFEKILNQP